MTKLELPKKSEARTYLMLIGLGLLVLLVLWHLSYNGWVVNSMPKSSFFLRNINGKSTTLESLLSKYESIEPERHVSENLYMQVYVDFWDKMVYPKSLFVFDISIENRETRQTLWYPTILVLITDSKDYVRGKTLIQLWSEDNGIRESNIQTLSFHFQVPEDMQGDNIYVNAFIYGELSYNYPQHGNTWSILPMTEDEVYGDLPRDYERNRFMGSVKKKFRTFPSYIKYITQPVNMIISFVTIILITASFLSVFKESLRQFLKSNGILLFVMILMTMLLIVILLTSTYLY